MLSAKVQYAMMMAYSFIREVGWAREYAHAAAIGAGAYAWVGGGGEKELLPSHFVTLKYAAHFLDGVPDNVLRTASSLNGGLLSEARAHERLKATGYRLKKEGEYYVIEESQE